MTYTASQLADLESIFRVKHRYMRGVDTHDYDLITSCMTEDATATYSDGQYVFHGRDSIVDFLRGVLEGTVSSHQALHHEIDFIDESNALGVWRLIETVHFSGPSPVVNHIEITDRTSIEAASYYYDEYRKIDGAWLISATGSERIYEYVSERTGHLESVRGLGVRKSFLARMKN